MGAHLRARSAGCAAVGARRRSHRWTGGHRRSIRRHHRSLRLDLDRRHPAQPGHGPLPRGHDLRKAAGANQDILCTFDSGSPQRVSCWAGDEYLHGDASSTGGIASASGKLRVFAGLRDDPFFFNLDGFKHVAATVHGAATSGGLPAPDSAGCYDLGDPAASGTTANTLVQFLTHAADGTSPAVNHFHGLNVLELAVQVDLAIVNQGGPVVSVWASTNRP